MVGPQRSFFIFGDASTSVGFCLMHFVEDTFPRPKGGVYPLGGAEAEHRKLHVHARKKTLNFTGTVTFFHSTISPAHTVPEVCAHNLFFKPHLKICFKASSEINYIFQECF